MFKSKSIVSEVASIRLNQEVWFVSHGCNSSGSEFVAVHGGKDGLLGNFWVNPDSSFINRCSAWVTEFCKRK